MRTMRQSRERAQDLVRLDGVVVPRVVGETVSWLRSHELNVDGLFRARGNMARAHAIKNKYDRAEGAPLADCRDPHVVAGVLKLYLSALPEPLLTCNLYKGFLSVHTLPSLGRKLHTLRLLVSQLPEKSRAIVQVVLPLLSFVAEEGGPAHSSCLAQLFSPIFLRRRSLDTAGLQAEEVKRSDSVMQLLLSHCHTILSPGPSSPGLVESPQRTREYHAMTSPHAHPLANSPPNASSPPSAPPCTPVTPTRTQARTMLMHVDKAVDDALGGFFAEAPTVGAGAPGYKREVDAILGGQLGCVYDTPIASMSAEDQLTEKSQIKRRLRAYDAYFQIRHGTKPGRADKEHLRGLYIRYYKLKCQLGAPGGAGGDKAGDLTARAHAEFNASGALTMRMPLSDRSNRADSHRLSMVQ